MDPTKRDLKRKNTTLPYCTKTPRLQADNLSQNGSFVSGFKFVKVENDSVIFYTN
jgi:hypothetical protein